MQVGVLFVGVLLIRALLFGVYTGAPDCWKLPYQQAHRHRVPYRDYVTLPTGVFILYRIHVLSAYHKIRLKLTCVHVHLHEAVLGLSSGGMHTVGHHLLPTL